MRDPRLHPDSRRALSSGGKCWAGQKRIPVGGGQSCALNDEKSVEGERHPQSMSCGSPGRGPKIRKPALRGLGLGSLHLPMHSVTHNSHSFLLHSEQEVPSAVLPSFGTLHGNENAVPSPYR